MQFESELRRAKSSLPNDAIWCHKTWLKLILEMCFLPDDTQPSPEAMLTYFQLDHKEQTSVKIELKTYSHQSESAIENEIVVCRMIPGVGVIKAPFVNFS